MLVNLRKFFQYDKVLPGKKRGATYLKLLHVN